MSTVKRNFIYNTTLTLAGYIFPLLTFPYITRVLGVENLGLVNFFDSVINYLILFSTLGIGVAGIRAIASSGKDRARLSNTFSSLVALTLLTTGITLIVLVILTFSVKELAAHKNLMFIGGFKLLFNALLIEWFYAGIEDFKFITIRSLLVKLIYVICIFVFVRDRGDFGIYYQLGAAMVVINSIINLAYSRKFVTFSFKNLNIRPYVKPFLAMGAYMVLVSTYSTLNVSILGFVTNDTQVGYYTTATKLYAIILGVFTAFTGVMLPRMTSLLSEGKFEEFKHKMNQSLKVLILFSVPLIVFSEIFAPNIVGILAGSGFEGAIVPMRIIMMLVFVVGSNQVLIMQILMPLEKDKENVINTLIAAIASLILNALLVYKFESIGSAIVIVGSEIILMTLSLRSVNKYIECKYPFAFVGKVAMAFIPLAAILYLENHYIKNIFVSFLVGGVIFIIYYLTIVLTIFKKEYVAQELQKRLEFLTARIPKK